MFVVWKYLWFHYWLANQHCRTFWRILPMGFSLYFPKMSLYKNLGTLYMAKEDLKGWHKKNCKIRDMSPKGHPSRVRTTKFRQFSNGLISWWVWSNFCLNSLQNWSEFRLGLVWMHNWEEWLCPRGPEMTFQKICIFPKPWRGMDGHTSMQKVLLKKDEKVPNPKLLKRYLHN